MIDNKIYIDECFKNDPEIFRHLYNHEAKHLETKGFIRNFLLDLRESWDPESKKNDFGIEWKILLKKPLRIFSLLAPFTLYKKQIIIDPFSTVLSILFYIGILLWIMQLI